MKTIWLVGGYGTKSREFYLAPMKGHLESFGFKVNVFKYCNHNMDIRHLSGHLEDVIWDTFDGDSTYAIGHSMGGLVVSNAVTSLLDAAVTICSPHKGAPLANLMPSPSDSVRQMTPGSPFLAAQRPVSRPTLCLGGRFDLLVPASHACAHGAQFELINHTHSSAVLSSKVARKMVNFFDRHMVEETIESKVGSVK